MTIKLLATALCAFTLVACDSDDGDTMQIGMAEPTPALSDATVEGATAAAAVSRLSYIMPDVNGGQRHENAIVMVPAGDMPEGGWPVIGWGHGTTGVADVCAPSASDNLAGTDVYLNGFLAAGYAIVAADYEGLGTEGGHPFLHLDSEGRSINYAVEAAVAAVDELSNRYAVVGHSQGGHAALGAGSLAAENPGVSLQGIVAIAPASQILAQGLGAEALLEDPEQNIATRVAAAVSDLGFSSLILHGVKEVFPTLDIDAVYGDNGGNLQQQAEQACFRQLVETLTVSIPPVLIQDGNVDSFIIADTLEIEQIASYFQAVEPGDRAMEAPVLVVQGTADQTVLPASTNALIAQLSAVSDTDIDPELISYEGATHSDVLAASFNDILAFLATRFAAQ